MDGTSPPVEEQHLVIVKDGNAITDRCGLESVPVPLPYCDQNANTFAFEVSSLSKFALAIRLCDLDDDADGFTPCQGDCDNDDADTFPGAVEINDGLDNQCFGDAGFGIIDEISGTAGYHNPTAQNEYSWPAQAGATSYEVARASSRDFSMDCETLITTSTVVITGR